MSEPIIFQRNRASHIGVVTRDFDTTVKHWNTLIGAGPFYVSKYQNEYDYRGAKSSCLTKVAFGYWKDMQVQIVAQLCETPSIYSEILDKCPDAPTVHHILTLTDNFDGEMERYASLGVEQAAYFNPAQLRIAFMDTRPLLGVMMEIYEARAGSLNLFKLAHEAHLAWDGKDPIREHPLKIDFTVDE